MNYFSIEQFSLFYKHYAFVDTYEYLADNLFIQEKMRVHFGNEYNKKGCKYVIVLCRVKKRDEEKFLKVMEKLKNKMLILGNRDYIEFCDSLLKNMGVMNDGKNNKKCD
jgi:hypothetical protein